MCGESFVILLSIVLGTVGQEFYCNENVLNWNDAVQECLMAGGILAPFNLGTGKLLSNLNINVGIQVWTRDYVDGIDAPGIDPRDPNNYECGYTDRWDDSHGFSNIKFGDCNKIRPYFCKDCTLNGCKFIEKEIYSEWTSAQTHCHPLWNGKDYIEDTFKHYNDYWVNEVRHIFYGKVSASLPTLPTSCMVYTSGNGTKYQSCDSRLMSICRFKTNYQNENQNFTRSCFKMPNTSTSTTSARITSNRWSTSDIPSSRQTQSHTFNIRTDQSTASKFTNDNSQEITVRPEAIKTSNTYPRSSDTLHTLPSQDTTQFQSTNLMTKTPKPSSKIIPTIKWTQLLSPITKQNDIQPKQTVNQEHQTKVMSTSTEPTITDIDSKLAKQEAQKESATLQSGGYGLTVGLPIAIVIVVIVLVLLILYWRKLKSEANKPSPDDMAVYFEIQEAQQNNANQAHDYATYGISNPNMEFRRKPRDNNNDRTVGNDDRNEASTYCYATNNYASPRTTAAARSENRGILPGNATVMEPTATYATTNKGFHCGTSESAQIYDNIKFESDTEENDYDTRPAALANILTEHTYDKTFQKEKSHNDYDLTFMSPKKNQTQNIYDKTSEPNQSDDEYDTTNSVLTAHKEAQRYLYDKRNI